MTDKTSKKTGSAESTGGKKVARKKATKTNAAKKKTTTRKKRAVKKKTTVSADVEASTELTPSESTRKSEGGLQPPRVAAADRIALSGGRPASLVRPAVPVSNELAPSTSSSEKRSSSGGGSGFGAGILDEDDRNNALTADDATKAPRESKDNKPKSQSESENSQRQTKRRSGGKVDSKTDERNETTVPAKPKIEAKPPSRDVFDFGAGLDDEDDIFDLPAEEPSGPVDESPSDFVDDDDDFEDEKEGFGKSDSAGAKGRRRRGGRKSRKQRLAEEQEVIEKLAQKPRSSLEDIASGRTLRAEKPPIRANDPFASGLDHEEEESVELPSTTTVIDESGAETVDFDQVERPDEPVSPAVVEQKSRAPRRSRPSRQSRDLEDEIYDSEDDQPSSSTGADCEMLINVADAEECRIAVLKDGRMDELYIERSASTSNVGNIYKGRVTNIEPSIQAAFVDFGLPAHGFLHISDLHPQYFGENFSNETEMVGKKTPRKQRPPIQSCLKRGQEVIVQVIKEGIGTKGPTLSSYVSLPGRFVVMMPGMEQLGVSRKIEDDDKRRKMRELLGQLSLPNDMGFIVRTAGMDRTKRDLQRDLNYLSRLWKRVAARIKKVPAPAELYKESDLVIRTIRDVYDSSLKKVIVDSESVAARVREFLSIASPRSSDVVEVYKGQEPLFHKFGIEQEIDRLYSKNVPLPCGGSLVIEQTEAMVAVDVNSGRFRVHDDAEETAFHVNCEAVDELARQLRLRDLGGLVVVDLIDMGLEKHRRQIEKRMTDALRKHKERAKVLRISRFGLLEMTRQRQGPSITRSTYNMCPRCLGSGRVKAPESVGLDVMRRIRIAAGIEGVARVDVRTSLTVATDLLNRKRHQIADMEKSRKIAIRIHGVEAFGVDKIEIACTDRRGREIPGNSIPGMESSRKSNEERGADRGNRSRGGRGRRGGRRSNGL